MKQNWWKFLGMALLLYTFFAGLYIPLAPGIISAVSSTPQTSAGPIKLDVIGYNTHFKTDEKSLQVWMRNDHINTCAQDMHALDDTHLSVTFPPSAPLNDPVFGLGIYTNTDGRLYMENAFFTSDTAKATIVQKCDPLITNEKQDHFAFPFRYILYESMRNLFFHVPMWFTMIALLSWALFNNLRFLRGFNMKYDRLANEAIVTAVVFGILGLITGSLWARVTWGAWWVDDVKLNGTAITMLSYLAYLILRNAIDDDQKKARVTAIYSIFAYVMMLVLIGILPRLQGTDSLHPGNGGNPAFSKYDLDSSMRMIFYPAVAGWVLIGFWIYSIKLRMRKLHDQLLNT